MTALAQRRTRLIFETAGVVRERGRYRAIIIQAEPEYAVIRLKGTRRTFQISWEGIHAFAAKCEAERTRREKAESRKNKRKDLR